MHKKAIFIAAELEMHTDDVLDIILGNITQPEDEVQAVLAASAEYDKRKEVGKTGLDS